MPDRAIFSTMPNGDGKDFDHRIDLMCAVHENAPYIFLLREQVATLDVTFDLLRTRRRGGEDIRAMGGYLRQSTAEPVTASEYRRIKRERRAQLVPVRELAEIAVEYYSDRTDADYREDAGERVLSDEAELRAYSDTEQDLIELFNAGTLKGKRDETGIRIRMGTFYDWLGEPMPILSEAGCRYRVLPDSQAEEVASERHIRSLVDELITGAPGSTDLPLELDGSLPDLQPLGAAYAWIERRDVIAVRDGIRRLWRGLRCYEIVLAALAANEFNNEDPLQPKTRKALRAVRRHLSVLAQKLKPFAGEVELPEPNPEEIELLNHTIMRTAERYQFQPAPRHGNERDPVSK
ncbi:MAG: hypothetical protein M3P30_02335 [Chloroflexota bacterium]|nr:hypothetical protein [Chloroflexota bacterium]